MPAIPSSSFVLVTGGTGFIGAWVIKILLERGFSVRAVVRSETKAAPLKQTFPSATSDGKLSFFVSEDPFKEGALDEAVKGVDGVVHLASPLGIKTDNPDDFTKAAVDGTLGVLKSAALHGSAIKRVVVTSSCVAIYTAQSQPTTFSETDWNDAALEQLEAAGKNTDIMVMYRASKVLAERAAWKFYEEHKSRVGWDMVVLNPPIVFGPPLLPGIPGPDALGGSMTIWYKSIIADAPKTKEALHGSLAWADVRDIAEAHVLSLEKEEIGGERVIVHEGPFIWQEFLDIARELVPTVWPGHHIQQGFPLDEKVYKNRFSQEKQEKLLGLKFRTKEETTKDILQDFAKRGW